MNQAPPQCLDVSVSDTERTVVHVIGKACIVDSFHHMQIDIATSREEDSVQVKVDMNVWEQGYATVDHARKKFRGSRAGLSRSLQDVLDFNFELTWKNKVGNITNTNEEDPILYINCYKILYKHKKSFQNKIGSGNWNLPSTSQDPYESHSARSFHRPENHRITSAT